MDAVFDRAYGVAIARQRQGITADPRCDKSRATMVAARSSHADARFELLDVNAFGKEVPKPAASTPAETAENKA